MRWPVLACGLLLAGAAHAADIEPADEAEIFRAGDIEIIDPWAKTSIGGAHQAKLFFEFRNHGTQADSLVNATSGLASGPTRLILVAADEKERVYRQIDAIEIPVADHTYELTEVGYFIELTGIEVPILMGRRFDVDLEFRRAGRVSVEFVARFHSPKLIRRIREAAARGDVDALKALRPPR